MKGQMKGQGGDWILWGSALVSLDFLGFLFVGYNEKFEPTYEVNFLEWAVCPLTSYL